MKVWNSAFPVLMLIAVACGGNGSPADDFVGLDNPQSCQLSAGQLRDPNLTTEVPGGLAAELCDFGVFAWESFLYLTRPESRSPRALPNSGKRLFQNEEQYPEFRGEGLDSCGPGDGLFNLLRIAAPDPGPEAGAGTVYAVKRAPRTGYNVIVYNIRFSRSLCDAPGPNLPEDLVEIKTAWRFLAPQEERANYFWQSVRLPDGSRATLGLVGLHLAQVTKYHPEMIWSTWEHVDNVPDCSAEGDTARIPESGWTMMDSTCASCLADPDSESCDDACGAVNQSNPGSGQPPSYPLAAEPTNTCRVHPQGTAEGDLDAELNRRNILELNAQVAGPDGYLASLRDTNPQSVWKNYRLVGGIWFNTASDENPPEYLPPASGANTDRQRGSLALANTVMETTFQGGPVPKVSDSPADKNNCFACHQAQDYSKTLTSDGRFGVSHIAEDVQKGAGRQ